MLLKQKVTSASATYMVAFQATRVNLIKRETTKHGHTSRQPHSEEFAEKHPLEQWLMEVLSTMYGGISMVYEMNKLLLSYEIVALD